MKLPDQPSTSVLGVLGAELEAIRAVDGERIDVEPLQGLEQRLSGTPEERHPLLDLGRLRCPLEKEHVRERVSRSQHGDVQLVAVARKLVAERIDLGDGLLQIPVEDLVGGHGAHDRSFSGSPSSGPSP